MLGALLALLGAGCTFGGEDPPGCRADHPEDCGQGWTCRAGVCFQPTTALSPPASGDAAADSSDQDGSDAAASEED